MGRTEGMEKIRAIVIKAICTIRCQNGCNEHQRGGCDRFDYAMAAARAVSSKLNKP